MVYRNIRDRETCKMKAQGCNQPNPECGKSTLLTNLFLQEINGHEEKGKEVKENSFRN